MSRYFVGASGHGIMIKEVQGKEISVFGPVLSCWHILTLAGLETCIPGDEHIATLSSIVVFLYVGVLPSGYMLHFQSPNQNTFLSQNLSRRFSIIAAFRGTLEGGRRASSTRTFPIAFRSILKRVSRTSTSTCVIIFLGRLLRRATLSGDTVVQSE